MEEPSLRLTAQDDPRIGMTVQGRYRIVGRLGEGGMGTVYEGTHLLIGRRVAIKCLHAQLATNAEVVARFQNEAMATNAIQHPNIVEITDMGQFDDGTVFTVLEFLEGHEYASFLDEQGPQPVGRAAHVVAQVCDALQAAHDKGIIHRDLKPENVFLVHKGADPFFAKVLDFGIAKFKHGQSASMTQTGTTMGTPYYMAPEQAGGHKDIDARADIYSIGVILFQALTGQVPFEADSFPALMVRIFQDPPPPLTAYRTDLPPALVSLVEQMLAKDREQRPASCREVQQRLLAIGAEAGDTAPALLPAAASRSAEGVVPETAISDNPGPAISDNPSPGMSHNPSPAGAETHPGPASSTGVQPQEVPSAVGTSAAPSLPTTGGPQWLLAGAGVVALAVVTMVAVNAFSGDTEDGGPQEEPAADTAAAAPSTTVPSMDLIEHAAEPSTESLPTAADLPIAADPPEVAEPVERSRSRSRPRQPAAATMGMRAEETTAEETMAEAQPAMSEDPMEETSEATTGAPLSMAPEADTEQPAMDDRGFIRDPLNL